jgi:DNA-binding CsgD family transcriptional regulator
MSDVEIDEKARAALGRLTAGEKECLHRKLRHQTAKEIAIDLGVSPHAVEKRLKMARTKLGLSSSVEAARLLVAAERYQGTGPQAVDLSASEQTRKGGPSQAVLVGAAVMTLLIATAVILAVSQIGSVSNEPSGAEDTDNAGVNQNAMPPGNVVPSEAEIVLMNQMTFHNADADNSGYIDGSESPITASPGPQPVYRRDENGSFVPTGERVMRTADEIQALFYQMADKDGDGRISFAEFHRWSAPNLIRHGIPAAWREDMRHLISPEG